MAKNKIIYLKLTFPSRFSLWLIGEMLHKDIYELISYFSIAVPFFILQYLVAGQQYKGKNNLGTISVSLIPNSFKENCCYHAVTMFV